MKKILVLVLLLGVVVGVAYGLAKIGVIPVRKMAEKNKALRSALVRIGLDSPALPALHRPALAPLPDPLASEKKALVAEHAALQQERADWEAQRQAQQKSAAQAQTATQSATPDPKQLARMATVYEGMSADKVTQIFTKLPDGQVIALLRRMDEKQVGEILSTVPADRAARLTLSLSRQDPLQVAN